MIEVNTDMTGGRLCGKLAMITGAAGGIGSAAAHLFAKEGAMVALVDIAPAGADLSDEINRQGGRALFVEADVTVPATIERAVDEIIAAFGDISILYNNAGGSIAADTAVTETTPDTFWKVIGYNLFGVFLCCRTVIPSMIRRGGGTIVNTASVMAERGMPGGSAYSAAKGGVMALSRQIAATYAKDNIRCNTVLPGAVSSPRLLALLENSPISEQLRANVARQLLGFIEPSTVAEAALFLASDASLGTTGQNLSVDGGFLNL